MATVVITTDPATHPAAARILQAAARLGELPAELTGQILRPALRLQAAASAMELGVECVRNQGWMVVRNVCHGRAWSLRGQTNTKVFEKLPVNVPSRAHQALR